MAKLGQARTVNVNVGEARTQLSKLLARVEAGESVTDARDFGDETNARIAAADELLVSVVSFAEMGIKAATGKLRIPERLADRFTSIGVGILPLTAEHGLDLATLPLHHRDPFDRLLVA